MTAQRQPRYYTLGEYFALEKASGIRYEYRNGEIVAMSGAQPNHNTVSVNLIREISTQLKSGTCLVFGSDQRVKVHTVGPYVYPDVSVVCPKAEFENIEGLLTLTNPTVIFEVFSPTTANDDRETKFAQYQTIPTLREYVLVEPNEVSVTHYIKQRDGSWFPHVSADMTEILHLNSIDCHVPLSEIYLNVNFTAPKSRSTKRRLKSVNP